MDIKGKQAAQVFIEVTLLTAYEELCKTLEIEPLTLVTPGRDYDENGELISWYEDECYPEFTDRKQQKLLNCLSTIKESKELLSYFLKILVEAEKINAGKVKEILQSEDNELKDSIEDYRNLLNEAKRVRDNIISNLLKPEISEYALNILNNEGLGIEDTYNILREFEEE